MVLIYVELKTLNVIIFIVILVICALFGKSVRTGENRILISPSFIYYSTTLSSHFAYKEVNESISKPNLYILWAMHVICMLTAV